MIRVTLEKNDFFAGQPNNLTISLINTEQETLTNIVFALKLPATIRVQSGSKQVEILQLAPSERFRHTLQIVPQSIGTSALTILNFSYRDGSGKTQRLKELSNQITVKEALPPPPKAEIDVKLNPTELNFKEWGKLDGQVTNIGQIALVSIKVRARGEVQCNEDISLGRLLTGETIRFSLQVYPLASGTHVPISIGINYIDTVKETYNRSISTSLRVVKKEESVSTTTFNNSTFGGGYAGRDYTGDVTHNYSQEVNLAKAAQEIQDLLAQLDRTYPTKTKEEKQTAIVERIQQQIKRNPTLKNRLWNALKAGSVEALKQALDAIYENPAVSISVEAIKGFLEAEYRE
ncbi:MAG: hypothetical protein V7K90_24555 [Nostoc sp.]|uniref:hypothetical protein n=1 Tax=Nostoc sp. TaxID=1180 RepID=UPI002FF7828C